MTRPLFAMDNAFRNSVATYSLEARCRTLAALGYDAIYLNLSLDDPASWDAVERLPDACATYDLDATAVYTSFDVTADDRTQLFDLIETVEGVDRLELALRAEEAGWEPSDPAGDDEAATLVRDLLAVAEDSGLTITLYPHVFFWLERTEDAVRLCERIDHPSLGIAFSAYHWYAVDGEELDARLDAAAPFLRSANLCGSRRRETTDGLPATIEPLDSGELDVFAVLDALDRVGFEGPVGLQSYGVGGDPYLKLERSYRAFRSMERRLQTDDWPSATPR